MSSRNSVISNGTDGQVPIGSSIGNPLYATITSTGGTIVFTPGHNTLNMEAVTTVAAPKVTAFSTSGTWTKSSGVQRMVVMIWSGGSGGGSGRQGTTATSSGGGGGTGGLSLVWQGPAGFFGATEPVVVGTGGAGGASQTSASTNGNPGSLGTASSFGIMVCRNSFRIRGQWGRRPREDQKGTGVESYSLTEYSSASISSGSGGAGNLTAGSNATQSGFLMGTGGGGGAGASSIASYAGGNSGAIVDPTTVDTWVAATAGTSGGRWNQWC